MAHDVPMVAMRWSSWRSIPKTRQSQQNLVHQPRGHLLRTRPKDWRITDFLF